jgi:hypothetical protein
MLRHNCLWSSSPVFDWHWIMMMDRMIFGN